MQKYHQNGRSRLKKKQSYLRVSASAGALLVLALVLASCQTFQRSPLNLPAHIAEWRARSVSSEKVVTFAERLQDSPAGASSFNPSNGISPGEGETIALVYNPDLRLARAQVGVAKATAEFAGLWADPEFSLDVLRITEGVPDPWVVGSALSLTLPVSGRLQAEKGRAEAEVFAELERVAEEEWKVVRDLRNAWSSWSADRLRLEQTREVVSALEAIVDSTSKLAELGEIPKTEASLFAIEQASRRAELEQLGGEVAAGEQEIRALLGLSPSAPLRLESVLATRDVVIGNESLAKGNPTLRRLSREYEVSERTLLREIRKQYPDLTVGPQAESDEGQSRIGFIGAIPLPILNSNKGGIATARAEREVARAAYETEYEHKVGELAVLRARFDSVQVQRNSVAQDLIPLVDRQVEDARTLLGLGEGGSLVLLESLTRTHEAKLKIINLQHQDSTVRNEIRFLLGSIVQTSN
jgi:outer membrane protein TolC